MATYRVNNMLQKRNPGTGRGPLKVNGRKPRGAQAAATRLLAKNTKKSFKPV